MPGLFATNVETTLAHTLKNISIADFCAFQIQIATIKVAFKTQVRHHGCNNTAAAELFLFLPEHRQRRHDLVAVDNCAFFINNYYTVRITI